MLKRKVFQAVSQDQSGNYTFKLPHIDLSRATAVYIRQSGRKADKKHGESRKMQLGLKQFAMKLRGQETMELIIVYDEGAGKSGRKRIDERPELNRLWQDMRAGLISTVIVAREDRLFRDIHGDQSGAFSRLAEELDIWLFVPPFNANDNLDEHAAVTYYNFRISSHLKEYKRKMDIAADYISGHVRYMIDAKRAKSQRGGYDGRALPPGLVIERGAPKEVRKPVVYEPWQKVMEWVFDYGEKVGYNCSTLLREISTMPYLFPEIPDEDQKRYLFRSNLTHCPGGGYKPTSTTIIRAWFSNVMLLGWWTTGNGSDDSNVVPICMDNHPAVVDRKRFTRAYEFCMGQTLEGGDITGQPSKRSLQVRQNDVPPIALLHGRVTCPNTEGVHIHSIKKGPQYVASRDRKQGYYCSVFAIPTKELDGILVDRLRDLIAADVTIADRVKAYLEDVLTQEVQATISIKDQLASINSKLSVTRRRLTPLNNELSDTQEDDDLFVSLTRIANGLVKQREQLLAKKDTVLAVRGPNEVAKFYSVLSHFDVQWPKMSLDEQQRLIDILVHTFEIDVLTPHWLSVKVRWLDAVTPRPDVAITWRVQASMVDRNYAEEEIALLREMWPTLPCWSALLQRLPKRSYGNLATLAAQRGISKTPRVSRAIPDFPPRACWADLSVVPDPIEARHLIDLAQAACKTEQKRMYPIWALPASDMDVLKGICTLNLSDDSDEIALLTHGSHARLHSRCAQGAGPQVVMWCARHEERVGIVDGRIVGEEAVDELGQRVGCRDCQFGRDLLDSVEVVIDDSFTRDSDEVAALAWHIRGGGVGQ